MQEGSFGPIRNPIAVMLNDHRDIEGSLSEIRKLSKDLSVPDGACSTYESLYSALRDYEADLQEHVRLENDLLFPKAIKMAGQKPTDPDLVPAVKGSRPVLTKAHDH